MPQVQDDAIGYKVVKSETRVTLKQILRLDAQEEFCAVFERIYQTMRAGKFTGRTTVEWNQGGIRNIVTEEEQ